MTDDLIDKLRSEFEGKRYRGPRKAKDLVNAPMIRHLCEAIGDENPVYADAEFAATTHFGGLVAPPTALQVWTMRGLGPIDDPNDQQPRFRSILNEAGYTSVIATNSEQEYARYLRPGDEVTFESVLESVVGPKVTGLGEGFFVTTLETYRDQSGDVVGTNRFGLLFYKPKASFSAGAPPASAAAAGSTRPRPSINQDNAYFWEGIEADELRIQRCTQCRRLRHPAQPACAACGSLDWDWIVASGEGDVFSYAVHHYPPLPGFEPPYAVGLIALDESVRMVGEVLAPPEAVEIGMRVAVTFTQVDPELRVPQWRPA